MFAPIQPNATAWQPITPRGVAAFARASFRRLLLFQLVLASLSAGVVVGILWADWFPGIRAAVRRLPDQGQIHGGTLDWAGSSVQSLAEGRFLAISVDLDHTGKLRSASHVQLEFGRHDLELHSQFGYFLKWPYPKGWSTPFNRPQLEPWWGAWSPVLLGIVAALMVVGLLGVWTVLATLYAPVVWLVGLYGNRELGMVQSWKLAGAALMPGALVEIAALTTYGLAQLDLVPFLSALPVHIATGWAYLFLAPMFLPQPKPEARVKGNPFSSGGRAS